MKTLQVRSERLCVNENPNPIKSLISQGVLLVQWLEHPTGVAKVIGSIPNLLSDSFTR